MPKPEPGQTKRFTVVFEGDLGAIHGNPFHVASRFGKPVAIAAGDALDEIEPETLTRGQKRQGWIDARLSRLKRA